MEGDGVAFDSPAVLATATRLNLGKVESDESACNSLHREDLGRLPVRTDTASDPLLG
jgi:hypothetical protein